MRQNIVKLSLLWVVLMMFASCGKEELKYTLPRMAVNYQINITLQDKELNGGGGVKSFTQPRLSTDRLGFGGLFVVNSGLFSGDIPILYAFDLACPHEASSSVKVTPDAGGVTAKCNTCKSVYEILNGSGLCISGPSEKRLQRYNVAIMNANGGFRVVN